MKPTEIKAILSQLGGGANKHLGQHFLIDGAALETIVGESHRHPASVTLEIGPGLGVLTRALLDAEQDVVAVERDRRFVEYLGQALPSDRLRIVQGDAAELDWEQIVGSNEWQLVSNLPYAISSLALRKALWTTRPAENVVVLVQREVAERAVALSSPARGKVKGSLLALMVSLASESARIVRRVPAGAFYPPPKVESAVLQIDPMPWPARELRWGIDPEKIMQLAKRGFAHPRKLLSSNLEILPSVLRDAGLNEKARAEDLSPDDWARLVQMIG
jgi:16S rRNA (adenine1518-N6/adenine1519-N6)-dimethyltransferase